MPAQKLKNMETIFDHNPTDLELKRFGGRALLEKEKELGIVLSADSNNYQLGLLFSMRGDDKKANEYWAKIKHRDMLKTLVQDF